MLSAVNAFQMSSQEPGDLDDLDIFDPENAPLDLTSSEGQAALPTAEVNASIYDAGADLEAAFDPVSQTNKRGGRTKPEKAPKGTGKGRGRGRGKAAAVRSRTATQCAPSNAEAQADEEAPSAIGNKVEKAPDIEQPNDAISDSVCIPQKGMQCKMVFAPLNNFQQQHKPEVDPTPPSDEEIPATTSVTATVTSVEGMSNSLYQNGVHAALHSTQSETKEIAPPKDSSSEGPAVAITVTDINPIFATAQLDPAEFTHNDSTSLEAPKPPRRSGRRKAEPNAGSNANAVIELAEVLPPATAVSTGESDALVQVSGQNDQDTATSNAPDQLITPDPPTAPTPAAKPLHPFFMKKNRKADDEPLSGTATPVSNAGTLSTVNSDTESSNPSAKPQSLLHSNPFFLTPAQRREQKQLQKQQDLRKEMETSRLVTQAFSKGKSENPFFQKRNYAVVESGGRGAGFGTLGLEAVWP
ncbi:hypothetical protein HK097_010389, partial [Rhizophlyctis rosea]